MSVDCCYAGIAFSGRAQAAVHSLALVGNQAPPPHLSPLPSGARGLWRCGFGALCWGSGRLGGRVLPSTRDVREVNFAKGMLVGMTKSAFRCRGWSLGFAVADVVPTGLYAGLFRARRLDKSPSSP